MFVAGHDVHTNNQQLLLRQFMERGDKMFMRDYEPKYFKKRARKPRAEGEPQDSSRYTNRTGFTEYTARSSVASTARSDFFDTAEDDPDTARSGKPQQSGRLTGRLTGRMTGRLTGRLTGRNTGRRTGRETGRQLTGRETGRETGRHTGRDTGRLTGRTTGRSTRRSSSAAAADGGDNDVAFDTSRTDLTIQVGALEAEKQKLEEMMAQIDARLMQSLSTARKADGASRANNITAVYPGTYRDTRATPRPGERRQ